MDTGTRRAINEAAVKQFFASWDPNWRWILVLGLRDLRANIGRLGDLAASEAGHESWTDESYNYGPLALGITAAAVNEACQHCEDLYALLSFLTEPQHFVQRMGGYSPGRVVSLATTLSNESDEKIAQRFLVPDQATLKRGLAAAKNPQESLAVAQAGLSRLAVLTREVADFYSTYEIFHVQYKHGLKLALHPFGGQLPAETVVSRKKNVRAPLFALSNETINKMLQRPPPQHTMMIPLLPEAQPHLSELVTERDLFRYHTSGPEVDLDDVVRCSWTVSRLLRIAATNRLTLGALDGGLQTFDLPTEGDRGTVNLSLRLDKPVELADFR